MIAGNFLIRQKDRIDRTTRTKIWYRLVKSYCNSFFTNIPHWNRFSAVGIFYRFHSKLWNERCNLVSACYAEYLEDPTFVFCFGNGSVFCRKKKKLERITERPGTPYFSTPRFRKYFYCTAACFSFSILLWVRSWILNKHGALMVSA